MTTRIVEAVFMTACVLIAVLVFASIVKYFASGLTDFQFGAALFISIFIGGLNFLFNKK